MPRLRDKIQLKNIPFDRIKPPVAPLDESLQESLLEVDQKDPIKVRPISDSEYEYELVNGRRRYEVAKIEGWRTIMALIESMDETELHIQALIGNSGTPNEMDEADHMAYLREQGFTGDQISKMCRYSAATVSSRFRLVDKLHPGFQDKLRRGDIKVSVAFELTKLPLEEQEEILMNGSTLTYKETYERVRAFQSTAFDDLFEPENEVKPGLFLTAEQVENLLSGESIEVNWTEYTFTLQRRIG